MGPVCFRYCLFGDTVKMAAKMEFTSLPNCIQVTGKTADFLRPFEPEFFVQKRTKKDKVRNAALMLDVK